MRKILLVSNVLLCCMFNLFTCNKNADFDNDKDDSVVVEKEYFFIKANDEQYFADLRNSIEFSIDKDKSYLKNPSEVSYFIASDNEIGASMEGNRFSAESSGTVVVKGKYDNLISENSITINVSFYSSGKEKGFKNVIEETKLEFGCSYDVGLSKDEIEKYEITKGNDYFRFNENGQLEVIGFGKDVFQVKCGERIVYEHDFSAGGSILCAEIRNILFSKGLIASKGSSVPFSLLSEVTDINLSDKLINDPNAKNGINLLSNLENLDLSYNNIDDFSFIDGLDKLKSINLSHNEITDIDFLYQSRHSIESLDLSDNKIVSLSSLKYFSAITYLDLSNNLISDIDFISELTTLKSLFLNGNKVGSFTDKLANLYCLEELGIGYCGLSFTSIKSLNYLDNLKYIDISDTNTKLDDIKSYTNIESLIMKDCYLNKDDLSKLNNFVNLKMLDISNNGLEMPDIEGKLNASILNKIESLALGGNEFDQIPNFVRELPKLTTLDLTNSYNITSLDGLKNLKLKNLILDECNSIGGHLTNNTDYCDDFMRIINSLKKLEKLSVVSGLNYMNKTLYQNLMSKVSNGNFSLRFLGEDYQSKDTVSSYNTKICFSMSEFLEFCTYDENKQVYSVSSHERHLILSLVNDFNSNAFDEYKFSIPKNVRVVDIYGNKYKTYNISFVIEERKESSCLFELVDFKNQISSRFIYAPDGSKTYVRGFNEVYVETTIQDYAMKVYDCKFLTGNEKSTMTIKAAKGNNGNDNHQVGFNGQTCLYCHSFYGEGNVTLIGGEGGDGRKGENGALIPIFEERGKNGYNGGDGGSAVSYSSSGTCVYTATVKLIGGEGGKGGAPGKHSDNKWGETGRQGSSTVRH